MRCPPLFTQLVNAQSLDEAKNECVSVIREHYSGNFQPGLESALHASWKAHNLHAMEATLLLAQKVQEKVPSYEKLMGHLQKEWLSWMSTPGTGFSANLPLYCKFFLDGNPALLDTVPVSLVPSYKSHISMWQHESLTSMFPAALNFMRQSGCSLSGARTMEIIENIMNETPAYLSCELAFNALKPEDVCPVALTEFLSTEKYMIENAFLNLALRLPEHEVWKEEAVWRRAIGKRMIPAAENIAKVLSPEEFSAYCDMGEKYISENIPDFLDTWRDTTKARIAQENAKDLDKSTPQVGVSPRQSRL